MNPMATPFHNAPQGTGAPPSVRSMIRHRMTRRGNVRVARTTTNRRRGTFTVARAAANSSQCTPRTAHQRHAMVIASPRSQAQEVDRLGGVEGEADKIEDFFYERAQLLARDIARGGPQLRRPPAGRIPAVEKRPDVDHRGLGSDGCAGNQRVE